MVGEVGLGLGSIPKCFLPAEPSRVVQDRDMLDGLVCSF